MKRSPQFKNGPLFLVVSLVLLGCGERRSLPDPANSRTLFPPRAARFVSDTNSLVLGEVATITAGGIITEPAGAQRPPLRETKLGIEERMLSDEDRQLMEHINRTLAQHPVFRTNSSLRALAVSNEVVLRGHARNEKDRQQIAEQVQKAIGKRHLENEIEVASEAGLLAPR